MTDRPPTDPHGEPVAVLSWCIRFCEQRGFPFGGIARQALQELAAQAAAGPRPADRDTGCDRCGGAVEQPATGRPRKYCTDCSPRKPRKADTAA